MAVVQISRIQIRRGKRVGGTGLPQLASGEMAWAVDTQELFIGNGSVAEGSPAVGNTKIITSKDLASDSNLFGLVQYVYKVDENITVQDNAPVARTVQQRLDDQVNTTDFGTLGNYNPETGLGADDTNALQFAINQLFLNATSKASSTGPSSVGARIILQIPAGTFRLRSTLYIPSYASLIGAGPDKTFIYYDPPATAISGSITQDSGRTLILSSGFTLDMVGAYITGTNINDKNTTIVSVVPGVSAVISTTLANASSGTFSVVPKQPAIQFINDASIIGAPSGIDNTQGITQPRGIQLSGMTIHDTSGVNTCLQLDAVKDSIFEDLSLIGSMDGSFSGFTETSRGMSLAVHSTLVTTENNIFRNIKFSGFSYCVYAKQDSVNNFFENCYLTDSRYGFAMGVGTDGVSDGQTYGPRQTQIVDSKFYNIKWHGVLCPRGEFNTVSGCSFTNVGVDGTSNFHSGTDIVRYPQIYFGTHNNNTSNIKSDRYDDMEGTHFDVVYPPVVTGHGVIKSNGTSSLYLGSSEANFLRLPTSTDAFGVPVGSIMYTIDYVFQNLIGGTEYTRVGSIVVSVNVATKYIQISDEYNYAGADSQNSDNAMRLSFTAILIDEMGTDVQTSGGDPYAILFNYSNSTVPLSGYFVYSYTAIM
jgi:Major tropism determinant N-terminal domain